MCNYKRAPHMHVCSYTLAALISPVGFEDSAEHLEMICIQHMV